MAIEFTFPADCANARLAGLTAVGGEVEEHKGELVVVFGTQIDGRKIKGRASSFSDLLAKAKADVLQGFGVSTTHSIDAKAGYYHVGGTPIDTGRVIEGSMGEIPCSIAVGLRADLSRAFALVRHPDIGLIGVTPKEFAALGLPEIQEHPVTLV